MMEYFQPLVTWLEKRNKGREIGWDCSFGKGGSASPKTMPGQSPKAQTSAPKACGEPLPTR